MEIEIGKFRQDFEIFTLFAKGQLLNLYISVGWIENIKNSSYAALGSDWPLGPFLNQMSIAYDISWRALITT